jgi:hypothetical protein
MDHPLDRPMWRALTTRHVCLAEGNKLARRYRAGFLPIGAPDRKIRKWRDPGLRERKLVTPLQSFGSGVGVRLSRKT